MKYTKMLLAFLAMTSNTYAGEVTTKTHIGRMSKNCTGTSFCKVTSTQTNPNASGINATWSVNVSETVITLKVNSDAVSELPDEIATQFTSGRFVVEEAFTFPSDIATLLEATGTLTIAEGSYTVNKSGSNYVINFPLQ